MKIIKQISCIALCVLFLNSCKDKEVEVPLNFLYTGEGVTWDVDTTSQTSFTREQMVYFNADSLAKANKYDIENFQSCVVEKLKIQIIDTDPNPYKFNHLTSLEGFVGSLTSQKQLFFIGSSMPAVSEYEVPIIGGVELRELTLNKRFAMYVKATSSGPTTHKFKIKANLITYRIKAVAIEIK